MCYSILQYALFLDAHSWCSTLDSTKALLPSIPPSLCPSIHLPCAPSLLSFCLQGLLLTQIKQCTDQWSPGCTIAHFCKSTVQCLFRVVCVCVCVTSSRFYVFSSLSFLSCACVYQVIAHCTLTPVFFLSHYLCVHIILCVCMFTVQYTLYSKTIVLMCRNVQVFLCSSSSHPPSSFHPSLSQLGQNDGTIAKLLLDTHTHARARSFSLISRRAVFSM